MASHPLILSVNGGLRRLARVISGANGRLVRFRRIGVYDMEQASVFPMERGHNVSWHSILHPIARSP